MISRLKDTILEEFRRDINISTHHEMRELWKKHGMCEDARDVEGILSTLTNDCIYEILNTAIRWDGKDGAREFYQTLLFAIPDAHFELTHIVIGPQGVYEEAILTGTHKGSYMTYRATGKPIRSVVGIFFPWDPEQKLFKGERMYASLDSIFPS